MSSVTICVTFTVSEVYEFEGENTWANEEEYIGQAKEKLLSDFNLSEWQGEWMNTLVNHDEDDY